MPTCNTILCNLETYSGTDKCILHCNKNSYQDDRHNIGFLETFYTQLIENIVESIFELRTNTDSPTKDQVRSHLKGESVDHFSPEQINTFVKHETVSFNRIFFPDRDNRDYFDFLNPLDKLSGVSFNLCEFNTTSLDLKNVSVFFDECVFHSHWFLYNHNMLENGRNVLYMSCTFRNRVSTVVDDYASNELINPIFSDCKFNKELILERIEIKSPVFKNTEFRYFHIKLIEIFSCILHADFTLNKYVIGSFHCGDTVFNSKFNLKENHIKTLNIYDTNFLSSADCFKSFIREFEISRSEFNAFTSFEDCSFGKSSIRRQNVANFVNTLFLGLVTFRNARFENGLDLTRINIQGIPNFYNIGISHKYTDRETFRRIKDSFDKVGNFIEGNKYYAYEMKRLKQELKSTKQYQKKALLFLYEHLSNYGQSYGRPLLSLVIFAIAYSFFELGYKHNILYSIYPKVNPILSFIARVSNSIASAILPFKNALKEGMESVSLLFYIIATSLIWLIILAIKRSMRR